VGVIPKKELLMNKVWKKIWVLLPLLFLFFVTIGFGVTLYTESKSPLFITTHDSIPQNRQKKECCKAFNTQGLTQLNIHGSGLIYFPDYKQYFKQNCTPQRVYVMNLLNEEAYYYKDRPLRWYGMGFIEQDLGHYYFQSKPLKNAYKATIRKFYGVPSSADKSQYQTEGEIVQNFGDGVYYMPLKENPGWLGNQAFMEDLIKFFESIPEGSPVYAHCFHGKGRTTIFIVLYDIFRNAKQVPLQDIADRHYCLGREHILDTNLWLKGTWTQEALNARTELIKRFYDYMTDPHGYGAQTWTNWNHAKGGIINDIIIHRKEEINAKK
jgi:hypothetical protein